jgi:putative endonuclease
VSDARRQSRTNARRERGARARADGRAAELRAALWLMAKGYRILALRRRVQGVEIDLLARRGAVLAVVEVKARRTLAEALEAVTPAQRARLLRAGATLAGGGRPLSVRLDLVALAPGRWPRHVANAWP